MDHEVGKVEQVTAVELRMGRRLAPVGPDGRSGTLVRTGQVDVLWPGWLPHLKAGPETPAVDASEDGDWLWVYVQGPDGWRMAWSAGLPRPVAAEKPPLTALDDLETLKQRRGETTSLEVRKMQLDAQLVILERELKGREGEVAGLDGRLVRERARVEAAEQLLGAREVAAREEFRVRREEMQREHNDWLVTFKQRAKDERDEALAYIKRIQKEFEDVTADLLKSESEAAAAASSRKLQVFTELGETAKMFDEVQKLKADAAKATPGKSGWDLIGDAAAKEVSNGALTRAGEGLVNLVKLLKEKN